MSKKITDFFAVVSKDSEKGVADESETENEEEKKKEVKSKSSPKKPATEKKSVTKKSKKEKEEEELAPKDSKEEEGSKETSSSNVKSTKLSSSSKKRKEPEPDEANDEPETELVEEQVSDSDEKVIKKSKVDSKVSSNNYYDDIESYISDADWRKALSSEFSKPYFKELISSLNKVYKDNKKPIYPPKNEIFSAFNCTPLKGVKVVIIGQDPYHGKGQAHGLSFSVKPGVPPPPSLINIYKELVEDCPPFKQPLKNGFLEPWAKQGVFLLNAALTVEESTPNAHKDFGWYKFTDAVLKILNEQPQPIVFILWGGFAKKKKSIIKGKHHLILESGHPSPLSVTHFKGCKHFSKTNKFLESKDITPIDWTIQP